MSLNLSGWGYGFAFVIFIGEASVPPGWIDDCGRPTSAITLTNLLNSCDWCGFWGDGPLGISIGPADPGPVPVTCLPWNSGSSIIAGHGGTVTIGRPDSEPVGSCSGGADCPSEGQPYPCDCDPEEQCCEHTPGSVTVSFPSSPFCGNCDPCPGGCNGTSVGLTFLYPSANGGLWCNFYGNGLWCNHCGNGDYFTDAWVYWDVVAKKWYLEVICQDLPFFDPYTVLWRGEYDGPSNDPRGTYTKVGGCGAPGTATVS